MENNYRNTTYCLNLSDIEKKKTELNEEILKEHPRTKIIYKKIKDNSGPYKTKFMKIYNYKCSYCGASVHNIGLNLFEIDHYICESSFASEIAAGKIENLVLSCYDCNRSKSNFIIEEEYKDILNPDLQKINEVFYRDEYYYTRISEKYKTDAFINLFYKQLKLEYQTRRLDFLLMNIRGLCKNIEEKPKVEKLYTILEKLQEKRNIINFKNNTNVQA